MRVLAARIGGNRRYDSPLARLVNGLGGRHGLDDYAEDVCAFLAVERRHGRPKADALLRRLLEDDDTVAVIGAVLGEDFATFDKETGAFAREELAPLVETGRKDLFEIRRRLGKKDFAGALALKPSGVYVGTADLYRASALLGLKRYDEALRAARSPRLRRTAKAGHARLVELRILKAMGSKDYSAAAERALLDLEPFAIYGQVKALVDD